MVHITEILNQERQGRMLNSKLYCCLFLAIELKEIKVIVFGCSFYIKYVQKLNYYVCTIDTIE